MKISIIIPVYNAKNHISKCIESILANSFKDYELILIDDESKDGSLDICENYSLKDNRIKFYKNEVNKGISATRNRGIELAKGEYIMFCDNDDIVSPLWIQHFLEWTEKDDSILPICAICNKTSLFTIHKELSNIHSTIFEKHQYFLFNQIGIAGYIWNTIYKREIIEKHHIRFKSRKEKGDINEDLIFSMDYLTHVRHIVYTGYTDYCHTKNETNHSTVTDDKFYFDKYQEKYLIWKDFILAHANKQKLQELQILANQTIYHFIHALRISSLKGIKRIHFFKKVICSKEMMDALKLSDNSSKENQRLIRLIKGKHYILIWLLYHYK